MADRLLLRGSVQDRPNVREAQRTDTEFLHKKRYIKTENTNTENVLCWCFLSLSLSKICAAVNKERQNDFLLLKSYINRQIHLVFLQKI